MKARRIYNSRQILLQHPAIRLQCILPTKSVVRCHMFYRLTLCPVEDPINGYHTSCTSGKVHGCLRSNVWLVIWIIGKLHMYSSHSQPATKLSRVWLSLKAGSSVHNGTDQCQNKEQASSDATNRIGLILENNL